MNKRPRGRRPSLEITEPQRRTLKAIGQFLLQRGFPPTIKELADILGISHASAHDQVKQLVRKGYLRREPGKARGLVIMREPPPRSDLSAVTTQTDACGANGEGGIAGLVPVPILGRVAAGQPLFAAENVIGEVLVEGGVASRGRCFALEVNGDSMVEAGIREGDIVIVRQQPVAESGDIVLALLGDEATVKRLYIREEKIELRPENPKHRPITIGSGDELRIVGKVVTVIRRDTTPGLTLKG